LAKGLVWLAGHGPWVATVGTGFACQGAPVSTLRIGMIPLRLASSRSTAAPAQVTADTGTLANRSGIIPIRKVLTGAPWQIVLFSLGMYLVVYGCCS
jgi:Na+/H+ antiporter NhaD/arsenite permease-like protein